MSKFTVNLNCVVFSVDMALNKRFIFSTDNSEIKFPVVSLNSDILSNIEDYLVQFLKQYIYVNDLELLPQLIKIHSDTLSEDAETLNVVYGFIVPFTPSINNGSWIEFQPLKENKQSHILFEVMQKLR